MQKVSSHLYSVYNFKKREYFTKDYSTREEAYAAMQRYISRHGLTLLKKNELSHCKEYKCSDNFTFYINKEY